MNVEKVVRNGRMKDDKLPVFDNDNENSQVMNGGMSLVTRYHPFLHLMGVTVEPTENDSIRIRFPMRDDLCGHPGMCILHGGTVSGMSTVPCVRIKSYVVDFGFRQDSRT